MIINNIVESLKKNRNGILLMIVSSVCVCTGQLFWKLSYSYGIYYLLYGFILYVFGALVMIVAYKFGRLSVLQPVLSLNYVLTIILAFFVLHESITVNKVLGIVIIIMGVLLICGGDD